MTFTQASVVTGGHWTGSPNKSIDQIGKNCPKNVRKLCFQHLLTIFGHFSDFFFDIFLGEGKWGRKSAGVSQSVRETGRDESQSVPSPEKLFKPRDLELPLFEGSLPSCSPHSTGYTRTSLHPYFPVANLSGNMISIYFLGLFFCSGPVPFRNGVVRFFSVWGREKGGSVQAGGGVCFY